MTSLRTVATPALFLVAMGLQPQVKTLAPTAAEPTLLQPRLTAPANLLPPGKTQGTFHLTGLVRKDRSVVLRWASDQGEMPTEGVQVFRQKVGDTTWKDLTGRRLVGFLQGKAAEKALNTMSKDDRERLLAYPYGNVQHDPATKLRLLQPPQPGPDRSRAAFPERARDLTPENSLKQFRELRAAGRLNRADLQLLHVRADMDAGLADVLGLAYTDEPGRGQWRYKIVILLPEGGSLEVVCPKVFNTQEPTPVPQPLNLTAASGNGEVLLNWDEVPSEAVAGYNVYRAESPAGPWQSRLNADPVKRVSLELEDPEQTLRRAVGLQNSMERMLRPLPAAARTPQKVFEAHRLATEQSAKPGGLPTLAPSTSKSIKDAVASGRLRPGGLQAPRSLFTDSRRTAGNALENERTYFYKVTAVDIGGLEQPLDTAPVVPGTPRDLQPPQVPGRPMLKTEMAARADLHTAQAARLKDPRLVTLDQTLLAKQAAPRPPLTPFQLNAATAPAAAPAALQGVSLSEARRMNLSRTVATMPVAALQKLGEAGVLRSLPDGTVPPAQLAWSPAPDADLKGYEVHRATGTGAFSKVADTTLPEWIDSGLAAGQAYRYAICSVDKLGNVSARSPEGRIEVCDSSLPGRLAITQFTGQVTKDAPPTLPSRRFIRPADRIMASGALLGAKAAVVSSKTTESTVAPFHATKTPSTPRPRVPALTGSAAPISPARSLVVAPAKDLSTVKAATLAKPSFVKVNRSVNPMLAAITAPKEIHVLLEWAKPLQGFPMEYVIQQAPQRMELQSGPRPPVAFQPGLRSFDLLRTPTLGASRAALSAGGAAPLSPSSATLTAKASLASKSGTPAAGPIAGSPVLHLQATRGLVASAGAGLRLAEARKNDMAILVPKGGPGTFTRVNETPVGTERFIVTFPAEVAQYGGATFFFRIQSFTKEFGRTVAGPVSDPIEVRLPDIVPPPSPAVGSIDLREGAPGSLDVALTWSQPPARDLAGVLVDRQPMNHTVVDGEARATSPAGPVERLTPSPVKAVAFTDKKAPGGFQRYTLRSVDATGNLSEALGTLEVLVPSEPDPGAPTQLALTGNRLNWKAATDAAGYTVWRSFTGQEDDYECISGILPAAETSFALPAQGTLHLRVLARSASGMNTTPSQPLVRTP